MLCLLQLFSSGFIVSFQGVKESNLETTAASAVSSPYVQYYKLQQSVQYHRLVSSISKHRCCQLQFLSATIAQSSQTFLSLPQYNLTATLLHCMQCLLLLNSCTFAGWVTGSLHHNVTGIFFSSLVNHRMICVLMRHEC